LLDTHALVWWVFDDPLLPSTARAFIAAADNEIFVSAVSAYEIVLKHRFGKWQAVADIAADVSSVVARLNFAELPVSFRHAKHAGALPGPHKDPFDRLLVAQALAEDMTLVSNERTFDAYGVARIW